MREFYQQGDNVFCVFGANDVRRALIKEVLDDEYVHILVQGELKVVNMSRIFFVYHFARICSFERFKEVYYFPTYKNGIMVRSRIRKCSIREISSPNVRLEELIIDLDNGDVVDGYAVFLSQFEAMKAFMKQNMNNEKAVFLHETIDFGIKGNDIQAHCMRFNSTYGVEGKIVLN